MLRVLCLRLRLLSCTGPRDPGSGGRGPLGPMSPAQPLISGGEICDFLIAEPVVPHFFRILS